MKLIIQNTMRVAILLIGAGAMQYCAPKAVPTASKEITIEEDLSVLRLAEASKSETVIDEKERLWAIPPKHDLADEIDSVMSIIKASRSEVKFLNGYTVQVYSGNNREQAKEAKNKVYELFEAYDPEITYIQPNFKVSVGKFYDRLEANRVYIDLKKEFPNAIVLPERIFFK